MSCYYKKEVTYLRFQVLQRPVLPAITRTPEGPTTPSADAPQRTSIFPASNSEQNIQGILISILSSYNTQNQVKYLR